MHSIEVRQLVGEIIGIIYISVEADYLNVKLPLILEEATGNEIIVRTSVDDTYVRQELIECTPIVPRLILNEFVDPRTNDYLEC